MTKCQDFDDQMSKISITKCPDGNDQLSQYRWADVTKTRWPDVRWATVTQPRSGPHSILARLWRWSFFSWDGDVKFSTMMRYWLFLDILYHHHCCDYFPKSSGLIIFFVWFWGFGFFGGFILGLLEVLGGFLRDLGFFWWVLDVLRGFQGEHHHCCNYFLQCFLR